MWQTKDGLFFENDFPFRNLVTTSKFGNLKDDNLRRDFCLKQGVDFSSLITAEQVHGSLVAVVDEKNKGQKVLGCDGLVTAEKGISLGIFTADCMPIFLAAKKGPVAGLIHAGWRGLFSGIIEHAVEIFRSPFGIRPDEIFVSIGPHIQKCCYVVSDDLKRKFGLAFTETNLSLSAAAESRLKALGLKNISINGRCSCHEESIFFSYRRDKTEKRMMSLVII